IATVTIGSSSGSAQIDAVGPGLYSESGDGTGVAAATAALYGADGSVAAQAVFRCTVGSACVTAPLDLGKAGDQLVLTLYGTGIRNNTGIENATALVGGSRAKLLYAGAQPQYPGLDQVNIVIPRSLAG